MLCSCGFKNNENSNYCSSCGKQLIDQKVFRETNQGGIRKTLKSVARFMPKKNISLNLLISFIIVVIILIISSIISENQTNQSLITIITSGFLFLMITYINQNLIASTLSVSKNHIPTFKETFTNTFKTGRKSVISFIIYFLYLVLISLIISLIDYLYRNSYIDVNIYTISIIIYLILNIYIYPALELFVYESVNSSLSENNIITLLQNGFKLAHKNRLAYYAIIISFMGWFTLGIFTFCLLYLWLMPYIYQSLSNFYLYIKKEIKVEPISSGLTNDAIVGIFFAVIVVIALLVNNSEPNYPIDALPYNYPVSKL